MNDLIAADKIINQTTVKVDFFSGILNIFKIKPLLNVTRENKIPKILNISQQS